MNYWVLAAIVLMGVGAVVGLWLDDRHPRQFQDTWGPWDGDAEAD